VGYGDELMVAGEAAALRACDPGKRRVKVLRRAARPGVPPVYRWNEVWENNPDMARPEEQGDFLILDENAGRRYRSHETPERRYWLKVRPHTPVIHLTQAEIDWARANVPQGSIVVEPTIKSNASPNKDWGRENWQRLVDMEPGLPWLQFAPRERGDHLLRGVRTIVACPNFRHAAAALAFARAAVLPEGGLHHAAAAVNLPAVVIFGGFISPAQTGYAIHENIFTGVVPCGMRVPCDHCRDAMDNIPPAAVLSRLHGILARKKAV
jgi:ADP-heptose:LPS heptosyltransferase